MALGSLSANAISLQTGTGDLTVNSALTAPDTIAATAGRDLTINGAVQGGSTVALSGARHATVNGSVAAVGDTTITAQTGSAAVSGNVQSSGAITTAAAQDVALGGTVQAQGPVTVTAANGSITGQGEVASSNGTVSLAAGQNVQMGGNLQAGTNLSVRAGADATLDGTLTAPGSVSVTSGRDATLAGAATAGTTLAVDAARHASIEGVAASLGNMSLSASAGTLATTGDVISLGTFNASGQQGVSLGGTVYSQGDASIGSGAGAVTVGGTLSSPGAITVNAAQDATVAGTLHSGGDTTVNASGNVALNGGLEADGNGNAAVNAGGNLTGNGAINVANNTTLTAGNSIALTGALQTGNDLSVTAARDLTTGAVTAVGNANVTATNGSAMLGGDVLTGGNLSVSAGTDVNALTNVTALGDLNLNARGGNLTAGGAVSTAGNATLNAGQVLALNGQTSVSGNATLTGANITTHDVGVGGNLTATAAQNLDTSAGTVSANGTATLTGATVTTGNLLVGGTYSATGSQSLTTTGTGAYLGDATLAGGTVTTAGTQMAAGTLTVSGSTVTNTGALSGLTAANIDATNLVNSGTVYGPAVNVSVANGTTNNGALMATNALTLTSAALDNSNGVIFAGDVNNPTAATGDVTVNVTGANGSFVNTNGQILGQNSVTLNLPQQSVDPSSATFGTVNGGNALNLAVAAIDNGGSWTLPGTKVTVSASQGITNTGTIGQAAGSLALNGAVANSGTIAAQDLTINGSLANQAGATVQAGDAFTLNGSGTNAGVVEALNNLTISGASYDNSNGTTKAGTGSAGSGNMVIGLSGDLANGGGSITATNDLTLTAANVINSGASGSGATTTTTTVIENPALLMALVVGSDTLDEATIYGAENGFCCDITSTPQKVTLADALSADGTATGVTEGVLTLLPGSPPVTTSGMVTFVQVAVPTASGGTQNLWFVETPDNAGLAIARKTIALPTVTETTTTTGGAPSASSVIAAGHDLNLSAGSLNNKGGTVSAGNDANINVQSLDNSGSTYSSTVTDGVDLASLNSFLAAAPSTISIWNNYFGDMAVGPYTVGYYIAPPGITLDSPGAVTPVSTSSSVTVQGATGQIVAGHNVNLAGGDLTNAGTIAAANDVNITANSFTNLGTNTGTMTTTAGCAAGYSGCTAGATTNNASQTYSYQQINANVTAGNDIVIAANAVGNTYGNLVAGRNVVIGGAGTSASDGSGTPTNLTQAASVTNTSGAIAAGNDVDINAASLVNTIAAPVQVHENYGSAKPYTGCSSNCEAYVDVQSASPATITANHDVNLGAGTFANTGSLVTGLNNVTINATTAASSDNQYLNAYWHANLSYYDANFAAWGCAGNTALCGSLYGGVYQSAQAQDPAGLPGAAGLPNFVPGTIQAGNTLAVNSPTLTNTGNVIGQTVSLTGSTLVNGLTNPNAYTPPPAVAGQVITLGPPAVPSTATTTVNAAGLVTNLAGQPVSVTGAAGLPSNSPIGVTTVGKPVAPAVGSTSAPTGTTVTTVGGQTLNVTYLLNSPASAVTGDLSPAALLAALPASLQPDTTQFYYDPYTQAQQVEQAALQATGKSSFYALPSQTDSQTQHTVNNLDTAALYGAALQYAEQNNVALGTQLSQAQLALIDAPMLWYVEETVPEPGCTATGNGACPTVQALMPEVLLPQNFATVNADGTISGTNVALNYANSILNTGSVSAENLSISTGSLTNEQRSTNVGAIYEKLAGGAGVTETTGTVVQQGGLMTAANYQLNVDTLNQIGGALQQVNADGSANDAASAQLLANLKAQLAGNFTQSSVSDNLQTSVVADQGMSVLGTVFMMTVMTVISIGAAGAASAAIGAMASAAGEAAGSGATFAAAGSGAGALGAGVGNVAVSAAVGGMVNSSMGQSLGGDGFSLGKMFEAGATAFVTAGLTNGITYANGALGFTTQASSNSLAALAGVQAVGGVMVPTAAAGAGDPLVAGLALAAVTGIQAGAQTAIEGGSFLTNLRNDAASNVAASVNYAIGNLFGPTGADPNMLASIASHAALGCAAGAASGQGCGGGAVGGAVSAALSPGFVSAMDPSGAPLNQAQQAVLAGFATAMGGSAAVLTGTNVQGAISAAQSEALNNSGGPGHTKVLGDLGTNGGEPGMEIEVEKDTVSILPSNQAGNTGGGLGGAKAEAETAGDGALVAGAAAGATNMANKLAFGDNGRKLDFLFNNNIDSSNAYNASRAAGNASRIAIADTPANRAEVTQLFNQAYNNPSSIVGPGTVPGSNLREFYLPGITGTGSMIQFVELNGKVLTIIAK
ncbi:filamentous hemagglutinin [Burkholderia sp. SRS-W-2-2016]|uniref:beta strand repeat-containing protein n=1 Tax=Burkholderia sp. SRS-W-2-2016 TaxID=1926878 RepID=UPI00094B4EF1|nr:S-layer family protein [Burkholderia sp. SRS-W-2-2016]OLL30936.1 filamentous hemagglutinin [Burkholderia sp. SRS-W-2-2016]